MKNNHVLGSLGLLFALVLLQGCHAASSANPAVPLNSGNLNLIFVVSPDLAYQGSGDVDPGTANLTDQGLQRSLLMATYLNRQVLGGSNVTGIYALEPMTHLQTPAQFPDLASACYIEQFTLLNQITLPGLGDAGWTPVTAASYPINGSYMSGAVPGGAAAPLVYGCQGLDFNDTGGDNETLVTGIIQAKVPGFHVFSAPWETIRGLMTRIDQLNGYHLDLPAAYAGPNLIYAISIASSGDASLSAYDSRIAPPLAYPVLPAPVASLSAAIQAPFSYVTSGLNGSSIPTDINTNETIYLIRHAEAHPLPGWDDGNYLGAGQWRALALPDALSRALLGRPMPTQVYSIDPAQVYPGALVRAGGGNFSYVRPALTVEPYAIAHGLPLKLVAGIEIFDPTAPGEIEQTRDFFFHGGQFSNQTVLVAWEHNHFPPIVNSLLAEYFKNGNAPTVPAWPSGDYDTIWTVTLDAQGNLKVDNTLFEGIDSARLPAAPPQF